MIKAFAPLRTISESENVKVKFETVSEVGIVKILIMEISPFCFVMSVRLKYSVHICNLPLL